MINKIVVGANIVLALLMMFLVVTFSFANHEVNKEQSKMIEKQKEKYGVERLTQEHYDEDWKALDKKQENLTKKNSKEK